MSALPDGVHFFEEAQNVTLKRCKIIVAVNQGSIGSDTILDPPRRPDHCLCSSSRLIPRRNKLDSRNPFYEADHAFRAGKQSIRQFRHNAATEEADALLRTAIKYYALAYKRSHKDHKHHLAIAIDYGVALYKYMKRTPDYTGPTEIDVLLKHTTDFSREERKPKHYLVLLNNLGNAYINRFRDSPNPQQEDLDQADRYFGLVRSCDPRTWKELHCRSLVGSARANFVRYNWSTSPSDLAMLENAVHQVQQVLDQRPPKFERECYQLLGHIYDALHRHGQHRDALIGVEPPDFHLDQAIMWTEKSLLMSQDLLDLAPACYNLAKNQFERHIHVNSGSRLPWKGDGLRNAQANLERIKLLIQTKP